MIDLRIERPGGTWTRRFGDHEAAGFDVSVNDNSAHVTLRENGIMFAVDRHDLPAAWDKPIDVIKLRAELIAAILQHMSAEVLGAIFGEIHSQRQRAFWDGENASKTKIREALGL
jgi:hypothetical protein